MNKKILIIGTVPYNEQSTSRAFLSYFSEIKMEQLAQIFSDPHIPPKGHCGTFYQITDKNLLERYLKSNITTGKIYYSKDLINLNLSKDFENKSNIISILYKIGKNKIPIIYLLRKLLWKKKYWYTSKLINWVESFSPDCIFLSFSDDFFIPSIALVLAKKFNIPIISSIGDDYFFNYNFSLSPLYHIYKLSYRNLIQKVLEWPGSAIYISDKIRDKYNSTFDINGKTIYLSSEVRRRPFQYINTDKPIISYFGNIRLGRNFSLNQIANKLKEINKDFYLNVYSNEQDSKYYKILEKNTNIIFHGSIPYVAVKEKMLSSDILVIVEGFRKKDINITRYSLSTKIADYLASGVALLAYGPNGSGAIDYMQEIGCIPTCTDNEKLKETIENLLFDKEYQLNSYKESKKIYDKNHTINQNLNIFRELVNNVCEQ
ncbi:MAG: hypothetical protein ACPKMZ_05190 [Pleomorphochaeta sp.]